MTWILDILRPFARITVARVAQATWNTQEIGAGLRWRNDVPNERGILDIDPAAAQTFASATVGNLAVTGTITQGPAITKTGSGTTAGTGAATVLTLPFADNHGATVRFHANGWLASGGFAALEVTFVVTLRSGSFGADVPRAATLTNSFGLPFGVTTTWAGGALSVVVAGPSATISTAGTADAGASTLITIVSGELLQVLTADLTGQSVTISGVVGGTGINGAHVATWVSATTFKIPVAWVGYTSGGAVALTTAPSIAWQSDASILATP